MTTTHEMEFPAGNYYVGDLAYILSDNDILANVFHNHNWNIKQIYFFYNVILLDFPHIFY